MWSFCSTHRHTHTQRDRFNNQASGGTSFPGGGAEEPTYNDLEVVAGDDGVSVLDPLDRGSRRPRDLALEDDVHGLVGVDVGGPPHKVGGDCGDQRKWVSGGFKRGKFQTDWKKAGA